MHKKILLSLSIILIAVNYSKAQDSLKTFGFVYTQPQYGVEEDFEILYIGNGSSAKDNNILPGDRVTSLEGVPIIKYTATTLTEAITKAKEKNLLQITLARLNEPVTLTVRKTARYKSLPCKDCKDDEDYFQDNIFGFTYKGQLKNNKINGKGTVKYAWDKSPVKSKGRLRIKEIQAEFADNVPGKGTYFYADGSKFEGAIPNYLFAAPYDNTFPVGAGKLTSADGIIAEGMFDTKGNKTGTFLFTKPNGDKFECSYVNNIAVSRKEIFNSNGAALKNISSLTPSVDLVPYQLYPGGKRDNKQLWGYKNKKGDIIIQPINKEPRLFKNNFCVLVQDKKLGLIDAKGNIIVEPAEYYKLTNVNNSFITLDNFKMGMITRNIFDSTVMDITKSMIKNEADIRYNKEYGGFQYETMNSIVPGFFIVRKMPGGNTGYLSQQENSRFGIINDKDSFVLQPTYKLIDEPGEGFLRVEDKDGKEGLMNNTGKWVVMPGKYDGMGRMVEGMAFVTINRKYGYINKEGKEIQACTLEDANDFKNGYARVKTDGKTYFIDKNAKPFLQGNSFRYLYEGKNNLFIVTQQNNKPDLLVSAKGESIVKAVTDQVVFTPNGYAYLAAGKVAINNGKEIKLPYDSISKITSFANGMLLLTQVNKNSYNETYTLDWVVDNTGKLIVESGNSGYNYEYDANINLLKKVVLGNRTIFICYIDDKGREYKEMGK